MQSVSMLRLTVNEPSSTIAVFVDPKPQQHLAKPLDAQ